MHDQPRDQCMTRHVISVPAAERQWPRQCRPDPAGDDRVGRPLAAVTNYKLMKSELIKFNAAMIQQSQGEKEQV